MDTEGQLWMFRGQEVLQHSPSWLRWWADNPTILSHTDLMSWHALLAAGQLAVEQDRPVSFPMMLQLPGGGRWVQCRARRLSDTDWEVLSKLTPPGVMDTAYSVLYHAPVGLGVLDKTLTPIETNPRLEQVLVTLRGDAGAQYTFRSSCERTLNTRQEQQAILHLKDLTLTLKTFPVPLPELHVGVSIQDVTDQLRTASALQESRQSFRRLLENITDAVFAVDREFKFVYLNPPAERLLGRSGSEMMGKNLWAEFPGLTEHPRFSQYQRTLDPHEKMAFEMHFPQQEVWMEVRAHPSREGLIVFFQDVTERHIADARLRQSEERFRSLSESNLTGVVFSRPNGKLIYINDAFCRITGYSREELFFMNWNDLTPPEWDGVEAEAMEHLSLYGSMQPYQKEFFHQNGHRVPVMVSPTRFMVQGEEHYAAFVLDLTEIKRTEQALRDSEARLRGMIEVQKRFVSDASHELRAPLTAIQGNIELLKKYPRMPDEDKQEALDEAQREAQRLGRLVSDLLALARSDAGAQLRLNTVRLKPLVMQAWSEAHHLLKGQNLILSEVEDLELDGNADRLKQLMVILLDNAIKYTLPGGKVDLSLVEVNSRAILKVRDTGIGIAEEDLPRVFDRFYRADPSRTRDQEDPGGSGLGLSIAHWIVEQHKGHIRLESKLGVGTTVVVELPLSVQQEPVKVPGVF
ncbi:PAS domain-containing sensor histidine kinase [Deinococcus cellulosilyticus]|uniref:histidine kinase n=1 Tax=Deinococcus cellulosilyticus (strain DSM 18568 / NBRC 106333 / KACC 11606 / 5516J-15) TaxID=1223518 RepID=A0A511N4S1_DEIC1|nr:PAS domain S-box protein [Deinococcus cellulosilyticus]GEM47468.1 hypothetical protein DC3_31030 [Deinococcus cellulosilyticus NBRC 106333 = KACC 11606]